MASQFPQVASPISPLDAIQWTKQHLFERRSIVHENELWRHALERARGCDVSLSDLQAITHHRSYVRFKDHPGKVSTREHLLREWAIRRVSEHRANRHRLRQYLTE